MTFGFGAGIQRLGSVAVDTLAALNAITPAADVRPTGLVYADPDPANNGVYTRSGGAWVRQRGLPDGVASFTGVGGTANGITAAVASGVDPAVCRVGVIIPAAANTGAATLNGEAILDRGGGALSAGALAAGVAALLLRDGAQWRLLTGNIGEISDVSGLAAALAAKLDASAIDTDGTMAADSDTKVASQKATRTYVAAAVADGLASLRNGVSAAFDTLAEIATELATKATTTYVDNAISALRNGVSASFDTLAELATAVQAKADAAATTTALAGKQAAHAILTALSGLTIAAGDLIVGSGANAFTKLAKGANGYFLRVKTDGSGLEYTAPPGVSVIREVVYEASGNFVPDATANAYEFRVVGRGGNGNNGGNGNQGYAGGAAGAIIASGSKAEVGNAALAVTIGTAGVNTTPGTPTSVGNLVTANSGRNITSNNNAAASAGTGSTNLSEGTPYTGGQGNQGIADTPIGAPTIAGMSGYGHGGRGGNSGNTNQSSSGAATGGPAVVVIREYR